MARIHKSFESAISSWSWDVGGRNARVESLNSELRTSEPKVGEATKAAKLGFRDPREKDG